MEYLNRDFIFRILLLSLLAITYSATASGALEGNRSTNVDMFSGEVMVLGPFKLDRIAIGNGKVIRVEAKDEGELIVIGESAGSTSLRLWHADGSQSAYNFRVSSADPETRVRLESMVRMNVKMVEIRKSAVREIGIEWGKSLSGPSAGFAGDFVSNPLFKVEGEGSISGLPRNVKPFSTYFGMSSAITSQINFLSSNGDAVTLAEPTLNCINGGTATFLAGGEIPYPITGSNGQTTVEFKEYGIKLNISPRVDAHGNISTSILSEISQIDQAVSVAGAPGILTRRTQTQVNVLTGETIVLSGLLNMESSKDLDELPGLGRLPVIGKLFSSEGFRNSLTELVIFVTPELIEPRSNFLTERESELFEYGVRKREQIKSKLNYGIMD